MTCQLYNAFNRNRCTSATEVVFDGDLLSVEEEDALDAGTIIEIGQELMLCKDLIAVT